MASSLGKEIVPWFALLCFLIIVTLFLLNSFLFPFPFARGRWKDAAMSLGAAVPVAGMAVGVFKLGRKVAKPSKSFFQGIRKGQEYKIGKNGARIAPWGNRTGHRTGKYPHYHREVFDIEGNVKPGGSIKRHRPWDKKLTDKTLWDRF